MQYVWLYSHKYTCIYFQGDLPFCVVLFMENNLLLNLKYIFLQQKHVIYCSAKVEIRKNIVNS